jgi:uncharacterized integral membrane protein
MTIFFLILGVLLGGASVIFLLQNDAPVTVTFFSWEYSGSLAIVLMLAMLSGILVAALLLLPSFVRDEFRLSRLRRRNIRLEDELTTTKKELEVEMVSPDEPHTVPPFRASDTPPSVL